MRDEPHDVLFHPVRSIAVLLYGALPDDVDPGCVVEWADIMDTRGRSIPRRARLLPFVLVMLSVLAGFARGPVASRADDAAILTGRSDAAHAVRWTGRASISPAGLSPAPLDTASAAAGAADKVFVVRIAPARTGRATLRIHWVTPEDLAVQVTAAGGNRVATSDNPPGQDETASFDVINGHAYSVSVIGKAGAATAYDASLWVRSVRGTDTGIPKSLVYERPNVCGDIPTKQMGAPPCYFKLKVPVNLVFVGFDRGEVDENVATMLGMLPSQDDLRAPRIKPVVLDESRTGGAAVVAREGGESVRQAALLEGSSLSALSFSYDYQYRTIVADERYSRRLFAAAKAATTPGEYAHPFDRAYIESYNARSAGVRRAHPVLPGSPIDFIDAMKVEDWVAKNPPAKGVTLDPSKGNGGYTYFIVDTYRPSYAGEYFNLAHFHNFRVMNSLTTDPDTGAQRGFDWGRVWGGRYRFLMLDVGAAPNAFEGSSQVHGSSERTAGDGDSSLLDPPIWEYTGCQTPVDCRDLLPVLYQRFGDNVLSALFLRFTQSYATRPKAADQYTVASQTWHSASAYAPWPSKLEHLYNARWVGSAMRGVVSSATVATVDRMKYLTATDAEQSALDDAIAHPGAHGPAADPQSAIRLLDARRGSYFPGDGPLRSAIPVLNVVLPGSVQWQGADADGSTVATLGPDPWGVVSGVNDITKAPAVTATVRDSGGTTHAAAVPDPRKAVQSGLGFSASALRGIGRYLGLFGPNEGVVFARELPADAADIQPHPAAAQEQFKAYYHSIDWTYATTASPLADGWFYGRFEVLDRDALMLGHTIDWIEQALDDVADTFASLDVRGYREVPASITEQILRGGRYIAVAVGSAQAGLAQTSVANARLSKRETGIALQMAMRIKRRPTR